MLLAYTRDVGRDMLSKIANFERRRTRSARAIGASHMRDAGGERVKIPPKTTLKETFINPATFRSVIPRGFLGSSISDGVRSSCASDLRGQTSLP